MTITAAGVAGTRARAPLRVGQPHASPGPGRLPLPLP